LGKAIGMNARKNGVLEHIRLAESINSYNSFKTMITGFWISDYDH